MSSIDDESSRTLDPIPDPPSRFGALLRRAAAPIAALAVGGIVLLLLHGLSRGIDYHAMIRSLRATPVSLLWWSALGTAASYAALILRDVTALRYAGGRVSLPALLLASFCGSALGNAVGFGALTGGAVRYRIYGAAGVGPDAVGRIMLFITAGFGLGLVGFAGGSALLAAQPIGRLFGWQSDWVEVGGCAALALVALALVGTVLRGGKSIGEGRLAVTVPHLGVTLAQILLTALDLVGAAAALWVLLPVGRVDLASFSAIFAAATALGVISHVPGGLGVFEAVVVASLGHRVSPSLAAAALLAYRAVYFLAPLLIAAVLLALSELRRVPASDMVIRSAGRLAPAYLSVVTFVIGTMLLVSGATPAFGVRLALLQGSVPLWAVEVSHFLGSLAGLFLLFIARGLFHRLDGAWWLALGVAVLSLFFSLLKGLAYGEIAAILLLIGLLLATRRQFTRHTSLLRQPFTTSWFAAVAIVLAGTAWILFFAFRDVAYTHDLWWQFEFDAQAPRALRAVLGAIVLAGGVAVWQLLRPAAGRIERPTLAEINRAAAIIRAQDRSDVLLGLMGDKSFLFSASGRALLMYGKRGRSWIALFDPVGPREEWTELIWRFIELADAHGGRAAFYQVRADSLPLYLEAGLKLLKLGEEARIPLKSFGLEGGGRSGLRYALKRGERDGLSFELLSPETAWREQGSLTAISQAWLDTHKAKEKSFSVAGLSPGFLAVQSVALVRQQGEPVAFVTIMATDAKSEATIGVMRQTPGASGYAMEFLFTKLALELKAAGFDCLSLGMAPLAGVERGPLSSQWHRIAELLVEHGGRVYNFEGLRTFKNKFQPEWTPRYLAASGTIGPYVTLADVAALTGGGG
ncbi:MAG TPA: bifunctional lysylphosphatidylglycerol flippase/synthetase MprF [Aliidongia sp.]|nr:bifunctional lysylphosphatidylglycerol flippase/synthetase MprF [Aliidongia sp.]